LKSVVLAACVHATVTKAGVSGSIGDNRTPKNKSNVIDGEVVTYSTPKRKEHMPSYKRTLIKKSLVSAALLASTNRKKNHPIFRELEGRKTKRIK